MFHCNRLKSDFDPTVLMVEAHDEFCAAMFRSVLTHNLHEYEPEIMSKCCTQNLVVQTLDSVPGLETLCLPRVSDINPSIQVASYICHLNGLRVFEFTEHCTDEVVMQLGLHCPQLTEVSFLASYGVTNDCVPYLLRLSKLQFLNLGGTQIDSTHCGLLLSQLSNIAVIIFANEVDDVLCHIAPETLDTITHICGIVNDINVQIQKCPKTASFVVRIPDLDLSGLTAWTKLHTLQISFGHSPTFNLNTILADIRYKLKLN
jgi:hypothetical protein